MSAQAPGRLLPLCRPAGWVALWRRLARVAATGGRGAERFA